MYRIILAAISACALSLLLISSGAQAQGSPPQAGATKPASPQAKAKKPASTQPKAKKAKAKKSKAKKAKAKKAAALKPVTLPPSKLNICQYGFAYVHLRVKTKNLKVKSDSNPGVVKAKNGPKGKFIILIAGKNFGQSVVTITGEMQGPNGWVPFIQKITVSVVTCKKPKQGGGGGGGDDGKPITFQGNATPVCPGHQWLYTLPINVGVIHVRVSGGAPASGPPSFDYGSKTVSGTGQSPPPLVGTVTVTGYAEAADEDIPFVGTVTVTVKKCPPPPPSETYIFDWDTGLWVGGELSENWGRVRTTETDALTDDVTSILNDSGNALGGGIAVGWNFRPWGNSVFIGPFASFDFFNQTINRNFAGGTFIGTTAHWTATLGGKVGIGVAPDVALYALSGVSWLNENLNINFGGPVTSQTTTVPGFTLGTGSEWRPSALQGFGVPVALFVQYQHTWWQNGALTMPAASPLFDYAFRRNDDTIKFGVHIYLGSGASPASAPTYPVKAPPLK